MLPDDVLACIKRQMMKGKAAHHQGWAIIGQMLSKFFNAGRHLRNAVSCLQLPPPARPPVAPCRLHCIPWDIVL